MPVMKNILYNLPRVVKFFGLLLTLDQLSVAARVLPCSNDEETSNPEAGRPLKSAADVYYLLSILSQCCVEPLLQNFDGERISCFTRGFAAFSPVMPSHNIVENPEECVTRILAHQS